MIRFEVLAARLIAAAAVAAGFIAFGRIDADEANDADREQELIEQIEEIVSRDGPYSTDLLEPFKGLVLLYEEYGDHRFALVTLERALHVVRVNHGLHTLDQVPWVMQKIRHEEARGNHAEVWELEQDLLRLIRRHPGDVRTAPMLRQVADRQMATLREYLDGQKTPEAVYGCFYKQWPAADGGSCNAGSRKTVVQGMLAEAQRNYADAIAVMLGHGLYDSGELRELEMELLRGVELVRSLYAGGYSMPMVPSALSAEHLEPWRGRMAPLIELAGWGLEYSSDEASDRETHRRLATKHSRLMETYSRGRQSLWRLYAYEAASSGPPLAQAQALADIADWDLLHSRNGLALEGYEAAYAMLQKAGVPVASIAEVFAPATPVVLPAFNGNPLAPDPTLTATGHIDVAFTITKYGRSRDVEIREAVNATDDARERLRDLINSSRFRPRLTDGVFADTTPVAFRYYLHE
jgi:hypothetical protein